MSPTTETVTITHTFEGIRVHWPDGRVSVFTNQTHLAESYAICERQREAARVLTVDLRGRLAELEAAMTGSTTSDEDEDKEARRKAMEAVLESFADIVRAVSQ